MKLYADHHGARAGGPSDVRVTVTPAVSGDSAGDSDVRLMTYSEARLRRMSVGSFKLNHDHAVSKIIAGPIMKMAT